LIIKSGFDKTILCRVGASDSGAKNLAETQGTRQETPRESTTPDEATIKGLMAQYVYWLEKEGYSKESQYPKLLRLLVKKGANLLDPESVKSAIAKQETWNDATKLLAVCAYDILAKMLKLQWTRPKYRQGDILPFIPEEKELDCLIAACKSRMLATYLQTLKETFADPGEALRLRWIDFSDNIITINKPVKGHNPRQLKIPSKLVAMLNALPRTSERIFPTTYRSIVASYLKLRSRVARTLQNPRLKSISLTTFRHWGATMTYHYTKDILLVQKLLGHKNIKNTMKYTQLVHFKDDEFDVATATTVEEAKQLLAVGFEKADELNGIHVYRRPKRFGC
jgi:integrase